MRAAGQPRERRLRVRRLLVDAAPLTASAVGTVNISSGALKAEVTVAELPLSQAGELNAAWKRFGLKGHLSGTVSVSGPWKRLEVRKGSLKVSRAAGRFRSGVGRLS